MLYLRKDTETTVTIGPFVSKADGYTPYTGVIAYAAVRVIKHNQLQGASDGIPAAEVIIGWDGYYTVLLPENATDLIGRLTLKVAITDQLPVWQEYMVLPTQVYDSLIEGTDLLQADVFNQVHCDWYIDTDTGGDAWELVYHKIGDTETEYGRKQLKAIDGSIITATNVPVGKHVGVV